MSALAAEKMLRAIERDIMWNQHVFLDSRDPKQKARVKDRLTELEADRAALKQKLGINSA